MKNWVAEGIASDVNDFSLNGPGLHYILLKWLIVQNTHSLLIQYPSLGLILFEPSSLRCILDKETIYAGDKG